MASASQSSVKGKEKQREPQDAGFRLVRIRMDLPLGAAHAHRPRQGVIEALNRFITRYIPSIGFVLISINYETLKLQPTALLIDPTANMVVQATFEGIVWRPSMGSTLIGRLILSTRSHVSLLIHNTFNAFISSVNLPSEDYHWDSEMVNPYSGPESLIQNDYYADKWREENAEQAAFKTHQNDGNIEQDLQDLEISSSSHSLAEGCWVNRHSGEPLGSPNGYIPFKVIALTMVNQTISVHGSLLQDPFANPASLQVPRIPTPSPEAQAEMRTDAADHIDEQPEVISTAQVSLAVPPTRKKKRKEQEETPENAVVDLAAKKRKKRVNTIADASEGDAVVSLDTLDSSQKSKGKKRKSRQA